MVFNGNTRRYLLSKPKKLDTTKKYPLVLNLHGNPGRPEDELAVLPFDSVTKQDAVIAYPAAANGSDWDFSLPDEGNPDMPFIKALIDELATKASIDPKQVLAYGYSGGAYFLSQYACRTPNVASIVKMVAFVSGGAPEPHGSEDPNQCVTCVGGQVPMFIAHGMNDATEVPFEGGDYARQCWAGTNGCTADDLTDVVAPCKKYNGCGQPTTWCPIPDHGHEPWTAGMQQAWDMFKSLP
jgi:polyhydroxybutyrate depolymerase